ncbi:MAG TPA: radical SAM/SPASM domain-containing protein [Bacteroidales bacterium]|nr:radical SAM/SPASM domain-containing protein [Bacteroidales bacterium]
MTDFSKHNIFSKISGSDNYFIVNLLTGNADILTAPEGRQVLDYIGGGNINPELLDNLTVKGYVVPADEEKRLYREKYLDFIDARDKDEVQLFFVPNYSCNFACTYCYQDEYDNPGRNLNREIIDAFFRYVSIEFAGRKKYITLFGGEPLLNSPKQRELIGYFLEKAGEASLDICLVTNGFFLEEYVDILQTARIREVQVTLDGTAEVHDKRRFLKGGGQTFEKIVRGIDACLVKGIPLNLRMVADRENINDLPGLARFAINRGWTENPNFKTQIGRNYELHHCQLAPDKLFSRISLYESIFSLTREHPYILDFYKPAYSISKFLAENGILPDPLFDGCPATKTEWAFDYTGHIFSCTATVGKADESLGTFYPEVIHNRNLIDAWESRDVTAIPGCSGCNLQLACGGGCGSVAKNRTGEICSTDCRPVKELLELGFAAYFEK